MLIDECGQHSTMVISVAVPVPFLDFLTYELPAGWTPPARGARVLVPVGSRTMTGIVVGSGAAMPETRALKSIADVLDDGPFLPDAVVDLALWTAEYYACGPGETLAGAMPPGAWIASERHVRITEAGARAPIAMGTPRTRLLAALRHGRAVPVRSLVSALRRRAEGLNALVNALAREGLVEVSQPLRGRADASKTVRVASATAAGLDAAELRLGARQREALVALAGAPEGIDVPILTARGIDAVTLKRLAHRGLVSIGRRKIDRGAQGAQGAQGAGAIVLSADQEDVLDRLRALANAGRFRCALLHGVTGSGKTEIYVRLAEQIVAAGKQVLMLVPEIALTSAVAARFRRAFGERVAIQHSGLSDGERHDQWIRIRDGAIDVVVGTRSAVFAPLGRLGLVVVDEEHDSSYKQEETPRYHGRDVAVMRSRQAGALALLGSATPSMESYQNALGGRYERLTLDTRVLDRPLPGVRIVDMREEYAAEGPDVILSRPLAQALRDCLARREQALLLLNRRGYAAAVFCRQCAATVECPNCSVSLTVHLAAGRARCHYCNYSMALPKQCPQCAGPYVERLGFGTERVEAEVNGLVAGARVARVDRDTVRRRGAIVSMLDRFAAGEIDVLVGTQMIAKGHDFPRVTLVGVISADVGLGLADFRASERTFQLLTQVAGRAGRGEAPGEAIIQTLYPDHYSIRHACRQDYRAFFEEEIKYRTAMRYPPAVALVNVIVRGPSFRRALDAATDLASRVRTPAAGFRLLGPAPAPFVRLRGEHRTQFFLKGSARGPMRQALIDALQGKPDLKRRVTIDVDPVSVL
jgi:primosomal protein N' (replication factor Y)